MNLPDMSMTSAPVGAGQLERVPAQAMRPSRITIDEFGVSPARGSISVAPTSAKVAGPPGPLGGGAGAGVVRQANGAAMAAARSSLIEVSEFSNTRVLIHACYRSRYDLPVTMVKLGSRVAMWVGLRRAGGQIEWRVVGEGSRWRVPVGAYSIEGSNDDPVIMTRSFVGSTTVRFPWRFMFFTKLEKAAGVRAVAAAAGHKGNAIAKFDRTDKGWRVSSMSLASRP